MNQLLDDILEGLRILDDLLFPQPEMEPVLIPIPIEDEA